MKFDSFRLVPRRLRKGKCEDDDDSTVHTVPAKTETISYSECESRSPIPRRVCFAEHENIFYENDLKKEDIEALWFSKEDFLNFSKESKQHVQWLREQECKSDDPHHWSRTLLRLYWAFQEAKTPQALQPLVDTAKLSIDENIVGTEHLVIKEINLDYSKRRDHILDEIMSIQDAYFHHEKKRQEEIAKLMQTKCRPSRIYAMYVAHIAAGMR